MATWNSAVGQELILKPEPSNYKDKHAVAVLKDDVIVGHVLYNIAPCLPQFLRREVSKAFAEVRKRNKMRSRLRTRNSLCVPTLWTQSLQ